MGKRKSSKVSDRDAVRGLTLLFAADTFRDTQKPVVKKGKFNLEQVTLEFIREG